MSVTSLWKRYCVLTIDKTKVNADATDFPVYLNDASMPSEIFGSDANAANADGGDIRFTSDLAGVNEIAREIAYFAKAGAAGSKCSIFLKIAALSSSVNTTVYMWWANSAASNYAATDTYGRNAVWSNNFRLVAHLYSTTIPESAGYVAGNATVGGTVNFADADIGCRMTNSNLSTTNYLTWAYDADVCRNGNLFGAAGAGNGATFEALCNPTDWDTDTTGGTGGRRIVVGVGEATGSTGQSWVFWRAYNGSNRFSSLENRTGSGYTFEESNPTGVAATDQWYYMAGIYTNEATKAYRSVVYSSSGVVQNATQTPTTGPYDVTDNTSAPIHIGRSVGYGSFNGNISEVRVSTKPRAASWIITTQENYFRPTTFVTNGGAISNSTAVNIIIQNFSISPEIVCSGSSSTLSWNVSGSGNVTVKISPINYTNEIAAVASYYGNLVSATTFSAGGSNYQSSAVTAVSASGVNIPAGYNRALILLTGKEILGSNGLILSATYGSNNFTLIDRISGTNGTFYSIAEMWYLPCETVGIPSSGSTQTVWVYHPTSAYESSVMLFTISGVSQNLPTVTGKQFLSGTSAVSATLTNVSANSIIVEVANNSNPWITSGTTGQTKILEYFINSFDGFDSYGGYKIATSAGNYTEVIKTSAVTNRFSVVAAAFNSVPIISGTSSVSTTATSEYILSAYENTTPTNIQKSSVAVFVNTYPTINSFSAESITSGSSTSTSGWSRRSKLTINYTKVGGETLTNFPVLITKSNVPSEMLTLGGANACKTDGTDIRVYTDSAGTNECPIEISYISQSADPANSVLELYTRLPTINSGTNTDFYIWYKNSSATGYDASAAFGKNNVWSNNYIGVWHLNNDTNNSTSSVGLSGTVNGSTFTKASSAYMGVGYYTFNGSSDYISITKSAPLYTLTDLTVEGWGYKTANGENDSWFLDLDFVGYRMWRGETNGEIFNIRGPIDGWQTGGVGTGTVNNTTWYNLAGTYIKSSSNHRVYIEGANTLNQTDTTNTFGDTSATTNMRFGSHNNGTNNWAGYIDEIRLSKAARTAGWLSATYSNTKNSSTFISAGTAEEMGTTTSGTTVSATIYWNISNPDCFIQTSGVSVGNFDRTYRLAISAGSLITSAETNVPLYYNLGNLSGVSAFWSNINADGGDLIITSSDGLLQLPLEVVWVSAGVKQGEIYFKDTGTLKTSANANKNIYYLYFGKIGATQPAANSTYGKNNVWNSNYVAVYHMRDLTESTGKASNLTNFSATQSSASYYDFNGTSNYLKFSGVNFPSLQNFTFENYIRIDGTGNNPLGTVLRVRDNAAGIPATGPGIRESNELEYHWCDQSTTYSYDPNKKLPTNQWFFYGWRISSASGICRVSGTDNTNTTTHNAISCTTSAEWRIGDDPTVNRFFKGYIDEVRLMSATMTEGWTTIQENMFRYNDSFWQTPTSIETNLVAISEISASSGTFRIYDSFGGSTVSTKTYIQPRQFRTKLTFTNSAASTNTSGLPLIFNLAQLSGTTSASKLFGPFWNNVQSDGGDLIVTNSANIILPLQVSAISITNKTGTINFLDNTSTSAAAINPKFYWLYWETPTTSVVSGFTQTSGNSTAWTINIPEIVSLSSSIVVSPTNTTTYTIEIINCCGTVIATVIVTGALSINMLRTVLRGVMVGIFRGTM